MKNIVNILVIALLIVSCKQEKPLAPNHYRLTGTVNGLENGKLLLVNYPNTDTIYVENGNFTIENKLDQEVKRVALLVDANNYDNIANLYIEPKEMTVELDVNNLQSAKLKGSVAHTKSEELKAIQQQVDTKYAEQLNPFKSNFEKLNKAFKNNAGKKLIDSLKNIDFTLREKLVPYYKETNNAVIGFIKNNPNAYVSFEKIPFLLNDISYDEAIKIYNSFPESFKKLESADLLLKKIEDKKKGIPGATPPNFTTNDINGKPLSLADFKGKYVLIDFWASWCVPCRKGNPHLIKLYNKYHKKGLEIIGVSDDDRDQNTWRDAVKKDNIGIWYHVLRGLKITNGRVDYNDTSTDISADYNISSLPTKILIAPNGVIIGRYGDKLGGTDEDMDKKLAEIFDK